MNDRRDLLPFGLVSELLRAVRSGHEPDATAALVTLSSWLGGDRGDAALRPGAADSADLTEVAGAVEELDGVLAARMSRPPVRFSADADRPARRLVSPAAEYRAAAGTWKPLDALWTTPTLDASNSEWSIWTAYNGEMRAFRLKEMFERPRAEHVTLLSSRADADALLARHGSVAAAARSLRRSGIRVIDFSWRCVLEAEIEAFRGRRSARSFPCGLGTACSLWLELPTATSLVQLPAQRAEHAPPADWFTYDVR